MHEKIYAYIYTCEYKPRQRDKTAEPKSCGRGSVPKAGPEPKARKWTNCTVKTLNPSGVSEADTPVGHRLRPEAGEEKNMKAWEMAPVLAFICVSTHVYRNSFGTL